MALSWLKPSQYEFNLDFSPTHWLLEEHLEAYAGIKAAA
jgi:hypothetical protein